MTITYPIGEGLYVNLTNRCSNSCDFCIRNNSDSAYGSGSLWLEHEPTEQEVLDAIFSQDLSRYRELVFCGYGEPLERLDTVVAVAREVKARTGLAVRVNTNGQADLIQGRPTAPELSGAIDTVSISLNTADAESYDRICHSDYGTEAFGALIAWAKDCKKYVPHVVMTVVDVIGPEEIEKCRAIAENAGVSFRVRSMIE